MGKIVIRKNLVLNSQANQILELIQQQNFEPTEFKWEQSESSVTQDLYVSKLIHKRTNSFFKFDFLRKKHFCVYAPGKEKQSDSEYPGGWDTQISYFNKWLVYLKRELESPNLWETILDLNLLKSDIDKILVNDRFTIEELLKIESSVNEIKEHVLTTQNLTESSKIFFENKMNYLVDSSKRLGRKDWIIILIGIITNVVISLSFSSTATKELFMVVSKTFNWLSTYTTLLK